MEEGKEEMEQRLEKQYKVREVTHIQASWTERERGEPGKFTLQLILDNGVEEYILQPDKEDVDTLLNLFKQSNHAMFDMERKVLMFGNLTVK